MGWEDNIWQIKVYKEGVGGSTSGPADQLGMQPVTMEINNLPLQKDKGYELINFPITLQEKCGILTKRASNGYRIEGKECQQQVRGVRKTWKRNKGKENVGLDIGDEQRKDKGVVTAETKRQWQLRDEMKKPLLASQLNK